MISKKAFFSLCLSFAIIQSIQITAHPIFEFLDNPEKLQEMLSTCPTAINVKTDTGHSLLQEALKFTSESSPEIIRILLSAGANPNETFGKSPSLLHALATRYKGFDEDPTVSPVVKRELAACAAMLMLFNADETITNSNGKTAQDISPELLQRAQDLLLGLQLQSM